MGKPRKTDSTLLPAIRERWSTRAFSSKPIPEESVRRIFEAARWAPSAFNLQPWRFIIGFQGDDTYNNILSVLVDANRVWASRAPLLVICISNTINETNMKPNPWHAYDCGQALAQFTIQAINEGLLVHQMAGFDQKKTIELFSVPDSFIPLTAAAIGFWGDEAELPEQVLEGEKTECIRFGLQKIVFKERFGTKTDTFASLG
ncbi:MAG: nitroreductase family protein [Bacteroidota bacterium]